MGVTCKIIEDLLPLYADSICSEDSRTIIEQHIAVCGECREKLVAMTAKLGKNEKEAKINNPFKKVRNHYLKLAAVTLLVCALVIAPLGGVWYLKTNELYDSGYSWTTMTTNIKLKKIGNLFQKGKYREALELFEPYYEEGDYTAEEINGFKEEYAKIFEIYFDGDEIKALSYYTEEGEAKRAYITISTRSNYSSNDELDTFTIIFTNNENGTLMFYDYRNEEYQYLPDMHLPLKDEAENYFNYLSDEYFNNPVYTNYFVWRLYTEERLNAHYSGEDYHPVSPWGKTAVKNQEILTKMLSEYDYVGCKSGDIILLREPANWDLHMLIGAKLGNSYLQKAELTMANGSEQFTVKFELPIYHEWTTAAFSNLRNIEYSNNTPEDFKIMFEDIFA